ncbi:polyribonucleotide nucleotidyltransferase [Lentisphaera profundi]|uniref:Polyribonucleotide nucleotidyltransferase n=1 Tax=Lentisphaera profundi TaxID=1658616 RepID=A0ABY7VSE5_9BACT|nr:polyribonucleotide nucleotidyltransferase [Lentisphaera profundi]WDE96145.1 polyribonucleotide nucleotidyltransferase [Lentisphaera profundi]
MSKIGSVTVDLGDNRPITIETGKMALLANAAVTVTQGETVVLVTACSSAPRAGIDFFPLMVAYREKYSAAGKFLGGYLKREGRPSEHEILTSRMTDRPLRPLFPKGFYHEVQIQAIVLSYDKVNDPDTLAMLGSSAALMLSDMPFKGPLGAMRVGQVDGEFVVNPTTEQMEASSLELIYSGTPGKTIMIEGDCDELSEERLFEALKYADTKVEIMAKAQLELQAEFGKAKKEYATDKIEEDVLAAVATAISGKIDDGCLLVDRTERGEALDAVFATVEEALKAQFDEARHGELKAAYSHLIEMNIRRLIIEEGRRADGRAAEDLRALSAEHSIMPRTHGSALFARGETQALVTVTLGDAKAAQMMETIRGRKDKTFYLHYNFPNYSVGECGRIMSAGNREVGHGNLAERCLAKMMPADYPYTVRVISEVMGSNGSTSMASICGGSLALMDAGVPLKKAVAGISVGLVQEGDKYVMITDILGSEDHYGDMDFKVAGTRDGITGFQLDLKIAGIPLDMMYEAMMRDKTARMDILDVMDSCLAKAQEEISDHAPQVHAMKINPEKIGALIGPGGKHIKAICEETGAEINVEDDGTVKVFTADKIALKAAIEQVESYCFEPEAGKIYRGTVASVKEFGAFVEIAGGNQGLLHISELADYRVEKVTDVVNEGDKVSVKILEIDDRGRMRLSRKAALAEMED